MPSVRRRVVPEAAIATALVLFAGSAVSAGQEAVERPPAPSEEIQRVAEPSVVIEEIPDIDAPAADSEPRSEMEEIIVIAPRPGDRRRVDQEFEDPVRARLLKEFYRMQELEEEYEWRQAGADTSSSRIKLGYDPRDDYRMRNEMALQDLSWEKTKPATIFSIEF